MVSCVMVGILSVLQCVALCCSVLQRIADAVYVCLCGDVLLQCVLQSVTVCCSVLQCVAVGCSFLQCVAVR